MSESAQVETGGQLISGEVINNGGINAPISPAQLHQQVAKKISNSLTDVGFSQSPEDVSAESPEANLSNIAQSVAGAEIVGDLGDALDKMRGNVAHIITGSENTHTTKRPKMGLWTTVKRVTRIANQRGKPQKMSNLLATGEQEAA